MNYMRFDEQHELIHSAFLFKNDQADLLKKAIDATIKDFNEKCMFPNEQHVSKPFRSMFENVTS